MSSNKQIAVDVSGLHKLYRLNANQGSLRDAVGHTLRRLVRTNGRPPLDDRLWALDDVSFQIGRGEALGVVGPNGAGKTTLLKVLSRVTRPTKGSVRVSGRLAALIELGAGFHPDLTGRENIHLNGSILGLSRKDIDRKFDQIVDFSGLERFIDTPVKRYSSGMYVRLGFSVAAHTDPDVLLIDEVLAVGDSDFRRKCVAHINKLRNEGVTVVFISHNLSQVRAVCNLGLFLVDGQVNDQGPIEEAIGSYRRWLSEGRASRVSSPRSADLPRDDGVLKIIDVNTRSAEGLPREQFDYSASISVWVQFLTSQELESLNYVIRIIRSDGIRCAEIRSSSLELDRLDINGLGMIKFDFEQLRLVSASYVIEIRIRDAGDTTTLAVGISPEFEVKAPLSAGAVDGVFVPLLRNPIISYEGESVLE